VGQSTLHAKLTDPSGKPLASAKVHFLSFEQHKVRQFDAITSAGGDFEFADYKPVKFPIALEVTLSNGDISKAIITKYGETAIVEDKQVTVTFKVANAKTGPMKGVKVSISQLNIDVPNGTGYSVAGPGPVITDSSGSTKLRVPADTFFSYLADAKGYPRLEDQNQPLHEDATVKVNMVGAVTLRGLVTYKGQPVAGANVNATSYTMHDNTFYGRNHSAQTGPDGRYVLTGVAGSLDVSAAKGDSLCSLPLRGVHVADGDDVDGIDIKLLNKLTLSGTVLQQDSRMPVSGVVIRAGSQTLTTAADGTFKTTVDPGDFYLQVDKIKEQELNWTERIVVRGTIDEDHNPPLTIFIPKKALLPPIKNLHGTVKDAEGHPIKNADVWVYGGDHVTSDLEGNYHFDKPVNPGTKLFALSHDLATSTMTMAMDNPVMDFTLDGHTGAFDGQIVDDAGTPIPNVKIKVMGERDDFIFDYANATSDASGHFHIGELYAPMSGFWLMISAPGYGKETLSDPVAKAGEVVTLKTVVLGRADSTIQGKVVDPDGKPAKGVIVQCETIEGLTATTNANGEFAMSGVPRGPVFLTVPSRGDEYGSAKAKGGEKDVVLKLTRNSQAAGAVVQDMTGQKAKEIKFGQWLSSARLTSADLKGKIVVLDLWGIWCHPCVMALPKVEAMYKKYKDKNVVVIGIHILGTPFDQAKAFVDKQGLSYPLFMDLEGSVNFNAFPAKGIPQMYVIAPDGTIECDTHDVDAAEDTVVALLKKSAGASAK
jgi:thiol-disulfide isomerase/thioredoxin